MEQRLIDANAFKNYLKEKFKDVKDQFQTEKMRSLAQTITNDFCRDIDEQPTVDAVPVCRCRDCKHNIGEKVWFDGEVTIDCANGMGYPPPNWFCADGERRSE